MSRNFNLKSSNPNWKNASSYDTLKKLLGIPSITDPKARYSLLRMDPLEKEFLSKEVSGKKVELDEVIVPSPELESSSSQKSVLVISMPSSEEPNDDDHETSDQVTTEPRKTTRVWSAPEWYVSLSRSHVTRP